MLTWSQNAGNLISEDLNFHDFRGEDAPRPPKHLALLFILQFKIHAALLMEGPF